MYIKTDFSHKIYEYVLICYSSISFDYNYKKKLYYIIWPTEYMKINCSVYENCMFAKHVTIYLIKQRVIFD